MTKRPLIYLLALFTLTLAIEHREQRKLHRLVGGHLRIINPDPDDAELLSSASSTSSRQNNKQEDSGGGGGASSGGDEKKTLSQQVADGKYGLIQKELFHKPPKRPGVISYEDNGEVPKDNIDNLGGLSKDEIWLAENHLLVLKGGTYPPPDDKYENAAPVWPAIDDYKAPNRQVKLPAHPKVPPPFPVQLTDDGPLQILGTNTTRTLNGTSAIYALPPPEGYVPGTGPFFPPPPYDSDSSNAVTGQTPQSGPPKVPGEYPEGGPFPPFPLNASLPPYFASLPPGAVIIPPPLPENLTEYDEDDPSIYYPPPYSFFYPKDNSSKVPAGPLVPGIILPPPPNFFGPLEEIVTTTNRPYTIRTRKPTTQVSPQIQPTTTPVPATTKTKKKPVKIPPVQIPEINNELKPYVTTPAPPRIITVLPVRIVNRTRTTKPKVTILRPVVTTTTTTHKPITTSKKKTTTSSKIFVYNNERGKPFAVYGPPSSQQQKTVISTTQIPLKVYYSTSNNEVETNSVTNTPPEKFHIGIGRGGTKKPKQPAQYYYYEEEPQTNSVVTTPKTNNYFDIPKEYFVPAKPASNQFRNQQNQNKPQYIYVTARPYNNNQNAQRQRYRFVQQPPKSDSFSIHIARLQKQIHQYYTTPRPYRIQSPKPVYQYSFQAANYQPDQNQEEKFRPLPKYSVQIQPAIEIIPSSQPPIEIVPNNRQPPQSYVSTERPVPSRYYTTTSRPTDYEYEDEVIVPQSKYAVPTPRPISQFSFEATPNPVYQEYYTKPEETYHNYDDITKKYFTMFGKKLPGGGTTPIPPRLVEQSTRGYYQNQQYQPQKPPTLEGDTIVNYVHPRPNINPDAELIPVPPQNYGGTRPISYNQQQKINNNNRQRYQQQQQQGQSELIKSVPESNQQGSYISYQLPGDDGAHFYFLTPQLAQRRDQGSGYYYEQPSRIRRDNDKVANDQQQKR